MHIRKHFISVSMTVTAVSFIGFFSTSTQAGTHLQNPVNNNLIDASVQTVGQTPEQVFTPTGFDSNDNIQVVEAGSFPNTCFKVGPTTAHIDAENKKIVLESKAYFYSSAWCLQVVVPYSQVINLGVLDEGTYEIAVKDAKGELHSKANLKVAKSVSAAADDHLYADIQDVQVDATDTPPTATLRGTLDYDCYEFNQIRVIHNLENVVEVLPILNDIDPKTANCKPSARPFQKTVKLPQGLSGKVLIHVRALNGQSVNRVAEFLTRDGSILR